MDVVNHILRISKRKGLNDQDICRILGLSKSGIYHWKNGKGEPSATQIKILARYFNVSTDYLLGIENTNEKGKTRMDENNGYSKNKEITLENLSNIEEKVGKPSKVSATVYNSFSPKALETIREMQVSEEKGQKFREKMDEFISNATIGQDRVIHLLQTMIEKIDNMDNEYSERFKALEAEVESLLKANWEEEDTGDK